MVDTVIDELAVAANANDGDKDAAINATKVTHFFITCVPHYFSLHRNLKVMKWCNFMYDREKVFRVNAHFQRVFKNALFFCRKNFNAFFETFFIKQKIALKNRVFYRKLS